MPTLPAAVRRRRRPTRLARAALALRAEVRGTRPRVLAAAPVAIALVTERQRFKLPRPLSAALAVVALGMPRNRLRHALLWGAHMRAYGVNYEIPYDEPRRLLARLRVDPPIKHDSMLAGGVPPSERLQRALRRPPALSPLDWAL